MFMQKDIIDRIRENGGDFLIGMHWALDVNRLQDKNQQKSPETLIPYKELSIQRSQYGKGYVKSAQTKEKGWLNLFLTYSYKNNTRFVTNQVRKVIFLLIV